MDHIGLADRADGELLVSHIQDLRHVNRGQRVAVRRNVVEEQFEVAHDDELADPALLDAARLRDLDVALVCRPDAAGWVDAQRPFRCNQNWHVNEKHQRKNDEVSNLVSNLISSLTVSI